MGRKGREVEWGGEGGIGWDGEGWGMEQGCMREGGWGRGEVGDGAGVRWGMGQG